VAPRHPVEQRPVSTHGTLVRIAYAGDRSLRVRGAQSGRVYFFSPQYKEQWVESSDSEGLVRTGLFRLV